MFLGKPLLQGPLVLQRVVDEHRLAPLRDPAGDSFANPEPEFIIRRAGIRLVSRC